MAADASTVATNPAGMTLLYRTQLMITSGAMLPPINFDRGPKTDVPGGGGGGGNAGLFFPIAGVFYAQKLSDRLWLGAASIQTLPGL
jgi:long-subunit fatty acid transport protein